MITDEELKNRLDSIIDYCEELAQWLDEVQAAMASNRYLFLDNTIDDLYKQALNMSSAAIKTRLAFAKHSGKFGNKKTKEDEE